MCGTMGDPELRSDESVLLRTQGIYVKSIPFEGILTNKRIILVDRTTNLLPQKEIPLVTLKDFQAGENAIRDQIITLSVLARTGETRQMILTFSRQTGGNRIKERDDWMRAIKENTSSSFEQVIRKVIPGVGQAPRKSPRTGSPRIEIISSPVSQDIPSPEKTAVMKERDDTAPIKKIIKTSPAPTSSSPAGKEIDASPPGLGTYCSRCGNRVPDSSKFCNRCGSQIVVPGSVAASAISKPMDHQPAAAEHTAGDVQPIGKDIPKGEPLIVHFPANTPSGSPRAVSPQPEILQEQNSDVILPEAISSWSDSDFPEPDEKSEPARPVIIDSTGSEPMPPPGKPPVPQKPWDGHGFNLSKKAVLGIIAIIIIVAILLGAYFLYPMISDSDGVNPDNGTAVVSTNTTNPGMATTPVGTQKPATTATYRPGPGNSGSRVGL
jgi:hypothetical protein